METEVVRLEKEILGLKEKLAAARRGAQPEPVAEYTFVDRTGSAVSLREIFGEKNDLLVVHNMGQRCVYCTLWADGLNGIAAHLSDRAAFVLCSPDDPETQARFAAGRGWTFRMVSAKDSPFAKDMGFEPEPGKYWPGVSAFHKDAAGSVTRTGWTNFGPGDDFCPVWPLLDLLKNGAGGWTPKYQYAGEQATRA